MGNTPAPFTQVPDYFHPVNVSLRASPTAPTEEPLPVHGTVLNGVDAKKGEFPHHVALRELDHYAHCGASIIDEMLLLTAAHCVWDYRDYPDEIEAVAGEFIQSEEDDETKQTLSIRSFSIHEDYDHENSYHNDIAIIILKDPIKIGDFAKVIEFRDEKQDLPGGAYVSGWGQTGNAHHSDILQKAWLDFVPAPFCEKKRGLELFKEVCAGGPSDPCPGDSGGPRTCEDDNGKKYICGITAHGKNNCERKDPENPAVFVDVRQYAKWIRGQLDVLWRHYWNTLLGQPLTVSGECGAGRFKCGISGLCLPDGFRCDGTNDCAPWDDSDEMNCQNITCPVGRFPCEGTRRCVAEVHVCDGLDDCGDGSDERNCQ